jgi:hypothetical protein
MRIRVTVSVRDERLFIHEQFKDSSCRGDGMLLCGYFKNFVRSEQDNPVIGGGIVCCLQTNPDLELEEQLSVSRNDAVRPNRFPAVQKYVSCSMSFLIGRRKSIRKLGSLPI